MAADSQKGELTGSLEDYLETVYLLIQERRVARVRDIARARSVRRLRRSVRRAEVEAIVA